MLMLTFVLLLGAALARTVVIFRLHAKVGERRQQAMLLAEAGLQRAIRAASRDGDYAGETWQVPADVLGDGVGGTVSIRVDKPMDAKRQRRIFVEAAYPDQGTQRFTFRRELVMDISPPPAEETAL